MVRTAEIAGAGLVGLTLATGLSCAGWSVRVHEAAPVLRATGGGLYILKRGLDALSALGLGRELLASAWRPTHFESRLDGTVSTYADNDENFRTMLRQDLYEMLLRRAREAGAEIVTGSRVLAVEPSGGIATAGGVRRSADLAVAADGVASRTPETLGLLCGKRRFGEGLIRILVDRTALVGPAWEGSVDCWSYSRRPLRALYTPCGPYHCYLALMAPIDDSEALQLPLNVELWAENFPDLTPLFARSADPGRVDRYGTIRLNGWSKGRAVVIGDAAHAMPSSLGQGANVGIANAVALTRHLEQEACIDVALCRWEEARRPDTEAIQNEAERLMEARALAKGRPSTEPVYVPGGRGTSG